MIVVVASGRTEPLGLDKVAPTVTLPSLSMESLRAAGVWPADVAAVLGAASDDDFSVLPNLEWVHSGAAGVDAWISASALPDHVVLTSAAGNGGIPLAEHAMLLMLMLDRDVPRWVRAQSEHRWDRYTHGELHGRTVGIVGLGHAGGRLARIAKAFGMGVHGMRRTPQPLQCVDQLHSPETFHEMLRISDFVVVTAPLTVQTHGMFGAVEFDAIGPDGFFVCVSRGGIADDAALLAALRSGTIAGAGLDAHGTEPLPAESPFWELPNVIITPHNGATTSSTRERGYQIMIENMRRFRAGERLLNVVDRNAGY